MREYHKWRIYYKKRVSGSAHAVFHPVAVPAVGWNSVMDGTWLPGAMADRAEHDRLLPAWEGDAG